MPSPAAPADFYDHLDAICQSGLSTSYNPNTHAFDLQLMDKSWQSCHDFYPTEALTSTAICLIGISRAQLDPRLLGVPLQKTLDSLYDQYRHSGYRGAFGLVIWANALHHGLDIDTLQFRCGVSLDKVERFAASLTTMETAWLASGLAHEYHRSHSGYTEKLLNAVVAELLDNRFQPETDMVCHAGSRASAAHTLRRWIANFADQVYTIQALAFVAKLTGNPKALEVAERIADKMVELQGDKGQWWWHYDARRGVVSQAYSVYSVHQHGMAPMALSAVTAAGGKDYREAKALSRQWLDHNELGVNLVDEDNRTIWRSIEYLENRVGEVRRKAKSLLGLAHDTTPDAQPLTVNYETRPYEWAWCLYAGAIERNQEKTRNIV